MQNVLNMAFATGLLYDVVLLQISTIVVWFCKVVCMMNMIVVVCCRLYHNSWLAQGKAMICSRLLFLSHLTISQPVQCNDEVHLLVSR